ncbi:MAG: integral rane sensor signal transduction histidine kinase [Clostridia bacterium]|jgi:signal transduction histidine kinase|nr:integral rane sensor signal transduction histidine kinase [Clostridia bacterium]
MKRQTLYKKIVISTLCILVLNVLSILLITTFQLEKVSTDIYKNEIDSNSDYAYKLFSKTIYLPNSSEVINDVIADYEKQFPYKIGVLMNGKIIYGNFATQTELDNMDLGYIRSESGKYYAKTYDITRYDTLGYVKEYVQVLETNYQLVIAKKIQPLNTQMLKIITISFYVTFLITSIALAILLFIFKKVTEPIIKIRNVAEQVADGNYNEKVYVNSKDEIEDLANAINNMTNKLKQNEISRDTFLASISHELRTPLATLKANTKGMLDGVIQKNEVDKYLKSNVEEIDRLIIMVNDLIMVSTFEQNKKLIKEQVDISLLMLSVIEQMDIVAKNKQIQIVSNIKDSILKDVDKLKMKEVFINVIDNAIKYSPCESTIKIELELVESKVNINIIDQGTGFKIEDLVNVFERFNKGDKSSGLGLGLYIAKEIIIAHNGTIQAFNNINSLGATIKIII